MNPLEWINWAAIPYGVIGIIVGYLLAQAELTLKAIRRTVTRTADEVHTMTDHLMHPHVPEQKKPWDGTERRKGAQPPMPNRGPKGDPGPRGPKGRDKDTPFQRWAIGILVFVTAIVGTWSLTNANERLDEGAKQREQLEQQAACLQTVEAANVDAAKARSEFSQQQASVVFHLYREQYRFLAINETGTDLQRARAYGRYQNALKVATLATRDLLKVAKDNPFPPVVDVRECDDKAGK